MRASAKPGGSYAQKNSKHVVKEDGACAKLAPAVAELGVAQLGPLLSSEHRQINPHLSSHALNMLLRTVDL